MQVIPSINTPNFEGAKDKIHMAEGFLSKYDWIHIDVGDGIFSSVRSWGDPVEFKSLDTHVNTEVHLMVENPEDISKAWLKAGVDRLVVHLESMRNSAMIMDLCKKHDADLMLAINPETIVENLIPYFHNVRHFQILGVNPGRAGQSFQESVLEKIIFLRERMPDAKIEVDGGVDLDIAKKVKEAGADMIVSATYIFEDSDPKEAYKRLESL